MNTAKTKLPPLPLPDFQRWQYGKTIDHFTPEQMRAYGAECAKAAIDAQIEEYEAQLRAAVENMHRPPMSKV